LYNDQDSNVLYNNAALHTQFYVRIDILFTHGRHLHGHIISLRNESWTHKIILNQQYRNSKGQSRMNNPEKVATLGTQDENKQPQKHNTTQKTATLIPPKEPGVNPGARER